MMRKHFYLVVDHAKDDRVGSVKTTDKRFPTAEKNVETTHTKQNMDTGERYESALVYCGYVDYDSEAEYKASAMDDIIAKLGEIDESHLEAAGLDPDSVFDRTEVEA
jgi:hypothetical protein